MAEQPGRSPLPGSPTSYLPYLPRVVAGHSVRGFARHDDRLATLGRMLQVSSVDDHWTAPVIDREFYPSVDRRMNPWLRRKIRRIPQARRMAMYAPGAVKRA